MRTAEYWIERLGLLPHVEGGCYREIYRSSGIITAGALPPEYGSRRNYATSIYFLLQGNDFSAFHRIRQDEIWHFHDGYDILLHCIAPDGTYSVQRLGVDLGTPQIVIPAGTWFAAELADKDGFALAGCGVSPGFDFRDFEMPGRDELIALFHRHANIIRRLTR
ncbi:cupin domain-containing protein [Ignavibacteria bacterium]|nr:cupin domain-containing protein [Bacteroidota bacterium]MCZ2133058.1 cupin domain-containing protein [Bacteroidota bacterium]